MIKFQKKISPSIELFFIFLTAVFISALFCGIFSKTSCSAAENDNLALKNISITKRDDSYLVWFRFNKKPGGIVKKFGLNGYSLELNFKNAESVMSSKFIKFNNKLVKAVEIIPNKNSGLNAIIYFHKNITVNKKNTYATFFKHYFIIKINHIFQGNLFKNIGKNSLPLSAAVSNIKLKNKINPAALTAGAKGSPSKISGNNMVFLSKHTPKLNMGFEIIKTAVYLALIIGLIYAAYFLMNKFKNRISVKEKLNNLKIASSINLGNKKSILLIEVNKEFFLVGVSQSGIQVIGHIKGNPENIKNALSESAGNAGMSPDMNADSNTYAEAAFQQSPSPAIMSYGKFADAMREQVGNYAGANEPLRKIRAEQPQDTNIIDKPDAFKVKNINQVKSKNKAEHVFFDIEERLKGLIERNSNAKKF